MGSKYAVGKHALGISDRSGFRYPLHRMRLEWTGMLVGYDEWEPKQPQLQPLRVAVGPQALKNPRPDRVMTIQVYVGIPVIEGPAFTPFHATAVVGNVSVVTT